MRIRHEILCLLFLLFLQNTMRAATPVVFGAFTVSNHQNNIVLKWETTTEDNSSYFEIQRSAHSGDQHFFMLATQPAAGNATVKQQYSFTDETAQEGVHYYRIKQYDNNNSFIYSAIVSIRYEPASLVKRFLNPVSNAVFAEFTSFDPNLSTINEWKIYDLYGRVIIRERITSKTVYGLLPFLTPGIYVWEFRVNDKKERLMLLRL